MNIRETIPLFTVFMPQEVNAPLLKTLHSGYIGQGPRVDEFEEKLSTLFNNKNILTLNSGTSALHLALRLAGVQAGDEVISTPMTCTATNMPILANGGTIVWADIDSETGLIDPLDVERKITKKTKAIMAVDWGGLPVDLDELMRIGKKYNVKVIEDSAHGVGATYKGREVGSIADYTCFSFQAIKHISTVDGGALAVLKTEDYKRGKLLRWYGIDREGERKDFRCEEDIVEWGYKFHMNDVAATIGSVVVERLPEILKMHRDNADFYQTHLDEYYIQPDVGYVCKSSSWLHTILLPNGKDRLEFMRFMKENGVMTSQVHARNDTHTTFKDFRCNLPGVDNFVERQVSIPVHWGLTRDERDKIVDLCNDFVASRTHEEL